jgi:hypothetical protein
LILGYRGSVQRASFQLTTFSHVILLGKDRTLAGMSNYTTQQRDEEAESFHG